VPHQALFWLEWGSSRRLSLAHALGTKTILPVGQTTHHVFLLPRFSRSDYGKRRRTFEAALSASGGNRPLHLRHVIMRACHLLSVNRKRATLADAIKSLKQVSHAACSGDAEHSGRRLLRFQCPDSSTVR